MQTEERSGRNQIKREKFRWEGGKLTGQADEKWEEAEERSERQGGNERLDT